ncbi:hypothetical protein Tco_0139343 [Tanacetum coccineum]
MKALGQGMSVVKEAVMGMIRISDLLKTLSQWLRQALLDTNPVSNCGLDVEDTSAELFFIYKDLIFESQDMSTSNTYQQSLVDAGSETRPLMLERISYIPWASSFKRYLNRKREHRKRLNKAIDEGPYEFKEFTHSKTEPPRMQTEEDLIGDDLKYYEAGIEAMNLIVIPIPNDIYNSVDACTTTQAMWQRLMNDLEQNGIKFPNVTINTKFLNCLQSKWLKYVTQVHLAKKLTKDSYDDLVDYLSQYDKLVNASRAKKLEKSRDPLTLVAHTGSSSRTSSPCYVTHPSLVVDYDDAYQGDPFQNNSEDLLTSAMIMMMGTHRELFGLRLQDLLQMFNATIVVRKDEAGVTLTDEQNDFLFADANRMEEIEELSANICLMARIQPANIDSDVGPSYDSKFLNVNSGSVEYDNNVQESYELEQLARNGYMEAEKQQIIAKKVQQQNIMLTKQLESYKEKV